MDSKLTLEGNEIITKENEFACRESELKLFLHKPYIK